MALDANLASQLKAYLENLREPVELVASLDGGAKSAELDELLVEIEGMSGKISRRLAEDAEVVCVGVELLVPGEDLEVAVHVHEHEEDEVQTRDGHHDLETDGRPSRTPLRCQSRCSHERSLPCSASRIRMVRASSLGRTEGISLPPRTAENRTSA